MKYHRHADRVKWLWYESKDRRIKLGQEAISHFKMDKYVRFDWEEVVEFYKEDLQ